MQEMKEIMVLRNVGSATHQDGERKHSFKQIQENLIPPAFVFYSLIYINLAFPFNYWNSSFFLFLNNKYSNQTLRHKKVYKSHIQQFRVHKVWSISGECMFKINEMQIGLILISLLFLQLEKNKAQRVLHYPLWIFISIWTFT